MKQYRFTDESQTWWVEFRTSGMENSITENIVNIRTSNSDSLELSEIMVKNGLPTLLGQEVSELELSNLAVINSLRLLKRYESNEELAIRLSTLKEILSFIVPGQVGEAVIDSEAGTVTIGVTAATDLTDLIATFELSLNSFSTVGGNDQVSGVTVNNFTDSVIYLVFSETPFDMKEWEITIINLSNVALMTGFVLDEQTGVAVIDDNEETVSIEVNYGTDMTILTPVITVSVGAKVVPASGAIVDLTNPVDFTVTSEDETVEKVYSITVSEANNTETDILEFSLIEESGVAIINNVAHTIAIEVVNGTVLTALVVTFTLSDQATAVVGITPQVSATTANDFTNPVVYIITAGDGITTQNWTVTVTEAA